MPSEAANFTAWKDYPNSYNNALSLSSGWLGIEEIIFKNEMRFYRIYINLPKFKNPDSRGHEFQNWFRIVAA